MTYNWRAYNYISPDWLGAMLNYFSEEWTQSWRVKFFTDCKTVTKLRKLQVNQVQIALWWQLRVVKESEVQLRNCLHRPRWSLGSLLLSTSRTPDSPPRNSSLWYLHMNALISHSKCLQQLCVKLCVSYVYAVKVSGDQTRECAWQPGLVNVDILFLSFVQLEMV